MDEENFIWTNPEDVPAEIQPNGEVTENNTGEQVANEGGNPVWWDETYPGQTIQDPNAVKENVFDPRQEVQESVFNPAAAVPDPYAGLTPEQKIALGGADPTDPYIRARLGIPQLPGSPLNSLPSTSNFFNSVKDVATSATGTIQKALSTFTGTPTSPSQNPYGQILGTVQKAVSALTAKTPAASPYAQTRTVQRADSALTSSPTSTKDEFGLTILDAAQTAQLTSRINPAFVNGLAPSVDTGAGATIAAANQQTAADAARLNSQSPNPYLQNIDKAATEISRGQDGIATANETIKSAQQKIADSESYIAQNNAELADPNISAERRAVLEANNAAQTQNIFDQTQSITENQAYIATTQETIQFNEATIDTNTAGYRATTARSNVPVVDVNADPNFVGPQQITATAVNPTTSAAPVNTQDGQAFGPVFPDPTGNGGFVDAAGNPVNADGTPIFPASRFTTASAVDPANTGFTNTTTGVTAPFFGANPDAEAEAAAAAQVGRQLAQQQQVLSTQRKLVNNGDWRVRLSLAPGAQYLYNVDANGILAPLAVTDGVVFPYTPKIDMTYKADYDQYALTHSNYKGYFYKSSYTDQVQLHAIFTAQDTAEANYLLAVIHFFRSVTKMFYGQDPQRGAPPPLVYLSGLGQYQFAQHPCVVTQFSYQLPENVDYIRARSTNINGTNMLTRRDKQDLPTNPISGAVARLKNLYTSQGISFGAEICRPPPPTLGQNQPTYVPTRMDININLLPIQTRQQVSKQFSLRQYANGDLLKGGFW